MDNLKHIPVMLEECLTGLKLTDGGIYFDGTLGAAGHSYEILNRTKNSFLYATDLDSQTILRAKKRLSGFEGRYEIVNANFKTFPDIKERYNVDGFDGILLDLGVSSFQLDDRSRGFSYLADSEKLDMRMDQNSPFSAETVVNTYSEQDLKRILTTYGEERFASAIARNIVAERKKAPITTCGQLVKIIDKSIPEKFKHDGHPAKRTFQAIRIEVNGELSELYETVLTMARSLKKGGRLVILTFHSLEDRIVKQAYKELECDCICDKSLPICVCGKKKEGNIITKHPILATESELSVNSRSKSAKLRIYEKI